MAQLVTTYHDLPLGAVDASVLAVAERTGDYDIATLDRRHFPVDPPSNQQGAHPPPLIEQAHLALALFLHRLDLLPRTRTAPTRRPNRGTDPAGEVLHTTHQPGSGVLASPPGKTARPSSDGPARC